mgnify:CR=1 FL=1
MGRGFDGAKRGGAGSVRPLTNARLRKQVQSKGSKKLVLDFRCGSRIGGSMDDPHPHHELTERLMLHAGALAETLATDTARVRAKELCGDKGCQLAEAGHSIALLLEAATTLMKSAR